MGLISKSKLLAYRQCPKRLWLELHRPELAEVSDRSRAIFGTGHLVGDIARRLYDPEEHGVLVDLQADGVSAALDKTLDLLKSRRPVFEAGFSGDGGLAFADVLLPDDAAADGWRMVEVKASGSVKEYQQDDVAIQSYIAKSAGVRLTAVSVAHIDTSWTYPGGNQYDGLLKEVDLTEVAFGRHSEVRTWLEEAHKVALEDDAPQVATSAHCELPYECGFRGYCNRDRVQATFPVEWLPRVQAKALKTFIAENGVSDMTQIKPELLNAQQLRVRDCTVSGQPFFDREGARQDVAAHSPPAIFMDFETINYAVPVWSGSRPFQQIPFQWSVHRMLPDGVLVHDEFLDLSGQDPSRAFSERLLAACAGSEPIFVYNASFEATRLAELAARFSDLASGLHSIRHRLVDLLPVAIRRYYHPSQQGSWSIKKLLPAMVPELSYDNLQGVADGGSAQEAFLEGINPQTANERRAQLREQLSAYCRQDTLAMVRIYEIFSGRRAH